MSVTALRAEAPETVDQNEDTGTALQVEADPAVVLRDPEKLAALYKRIDGKIAAHVPDLTTEKGRKATASLAFQIARTKTGIDAAAKKMTEEYRKATAEVNATRNEIVEQLEVKQKQARKPLTDWEDAEKARVERVIAELTRLRSAAIISIDETSSSIAERIATLQAEEFDREVFRDEWDEADRLKQMAIVRLEESLARILKEEADKAELDRLREEQAKRNFADSILDHINQARMGFIGGQPYPFVMIVRELEEKVRSSEVAPEYQDRVEAARIEALDFVKATHEEGQRKREAEAKAEQERREQEAATNAARDAAEKVTREAEQALAEERRKHQAELDRIERDRKAEADRIAQDHAAKETAERRVKAEADKRAADRTHRAEIMRAVKEGLMEAGEIDEATAKQIVMALVAGSIPHTTITF
ncbi:hypothetical protein [Labrys neptuniae]